MKSRDLRQLDRYHEAAAEGKQNSYFPAENDKIMSLTGNIEDELLKRKRSRNYEKPNGFLKTK